MVVRKHRSVRAVIGLFAGLSFACGDDGGGGEGTQASDTGVTAGTGTGTGTAADPTGDPPTTTVPTSTDGSASQASQTDTGDTSTGGTSTVGVTDGTLGDTDTDADPCGTCPANFICKYDTCIPDLGPCATHDDCPGDSYCDPDGQCVPYGVPPDVINDPECSKEALPEGVKPIVQCEWSAPEPGDPTINSTLVYTTPLVADLNLDKDPGKLQPSVILTTWYSKGNLGRVGTLRVFDGRTCAEQMRAGGDDEPDDQNRPGYGTQWVVGDLDGDVGQGGHPEIVGLHRMPANNDNGPLSMIAYRIDSSGPDPVLVRMWYGRDCDTDTIVTFNTARANFGPSIQDLDDDGVPELVMDEMVFDADGCLLSDFADFNYGPDLGLISVVADIDQDDSPDLVRHNRVAGWDANLGQWQDKPWFIPNAPAHKAGHIGLADAGAYSTVDGLDTATLPEVVIVAASAPNAGANDTGSIRMQKLSGEVVFGPIEMYRVGNQIGGRGGPPTISDFDGDGQVELASAGASYFAVYDPDCAAVPPPERPGGTCDRAPDMQDLPDGILWAQPSKDVSSNMTGSSIFDFDGDGVGEAVYRDECYLRVYNGKTGAVVFSAPATSGTGEELPVIADVDGDFATEIVVPRAGGGNGCPSPDPLFPASGPIATGTGFVILRDPMDRWASSRPVWNQHAYDVVHVNDDATIPAASAVKDNWQEPTLNNFRQNSQGGFGKLLIADLTVELANLGDLCGFEGGDLLLEAEICNRGTNPVQDGVVVHFLQTMNVDQPVEEATLVCEAVTTKLLLPGECEVVSCMGMIAGGGNVFVDVDPEDKVADCHPGNNLGADALGICPG